MSKENAMTKYSKALAESDMKDYELLEFDSEELACRITDKKDNNYYYRIVRLPIGWTFQYRDSPLKPWIQEV